MDLFSKTITSTGVIIASIMALVLVEAMKRAIKVFRIVREAARSFRVAAARIREEAVANVGEEAVAIVMEEAISTGETAKNFSIVATDIGSLG